MTYGWAILVIMVVGVLVWQMGLLNITQNVTPDKRGFSQITPLDWKLSDDGDFVVVVQNNAGSILDVSDADASVVSGGSGWCNLDTTMPMDDFRPASTRMLNFSGCNVEASNGEYYRVNVTISYTNPSSGLAHVSNGVVWGPVG